MRFLYIKSQDIIAIFLNILLNLYPYYFKNLTNYYLFTKYA